MMEISESAIVDENAILEDGVKIGPFSIIEANVIIGKGTVVEDNVVIKAGTVIGEKNIICHSAIIGALPQDLKFGGWKSGVEIGSNNTIREFVSIHKASLEGNITKVGNNCFLMAYVHLGHDCEVGNNVIIANMTQLGGFVRIHDFAFLSALIPVHQFCTVGSYSIAGGGYRIDKDIIPYALAGGEPLRIFGLNIIGLRRNNFQKETIKLLKQAFNIILDRKLNTTQAIEKINNTLPRTQEIEYLLSFILNSRRGIAK